MFLFVVVALIMSATFHEYMHGFAANQLGDPTAKNAGRLSLNPIKHLDLVGSILIPLALVIMHSPFLFGWAKPVPYNPNNLRDKKWGDALVSLAGPVGNLILAVLFAIVMHFIVPTSPLAELIAQVILINLVLMIFNLIPIPPLDGSKILASFLPYKLKNKLLYMDTRLSMILVFVLAFFGFNLIWPVVVWIFNLLV
ncbi:MAG: site-2 protease family protein [Patescibacteria group bacterium]